jgi:hypothetical protein
MPENHDDSRILGVLRRIPVVSHMLERADAEQREADDAERRQLQAKRTALIAERETETAKLVAAKQAATEREKKAKAAYDAAVEASRRAYWGCYGYSHSTRSQLAAIESRLRELTHPAIAQAGSRLLALRDAIRRLGSSAYHTQTEANWMTGTQKVTHSNLSRVPARLEAIQAAALQLTELAYRNVPDVEAEITKILATIPDGTDSPETPMEKVA